MIGKTVTSCCLALLALALVADGFCYRKKPPKSQESAETLLQPGNYSIWVCIQSVDLPTDLAKAPKFNTTQIWFSMSQVEKLKNYTFANFTTKLVKIEIWGSKLAEIEDNAFKGLKELKGIILPRNELTEVKAAWFRETPKLLELNLANNKIRTIQVEFLKFVPALINLDLRGNDLVTLPATFVKQLPASLRRLNLYNNPLNYLQMMETMEWSKSKEDKMIESKLKELKHVFNVTRSCLDDKTTADKSLDAIDMCVEDKMRNEMASIAGNETTILRQSLRMGLRDFSQ